MIPSALAANNEVSYSLTTSVYSDPWTSIVEPEELSEMSFAASINLSPGYDISLTTVLSGTKNLNFERAEEVSSFVVNASRPLTEIANQKISTSLTAVVPLDKLSRKSQYTRINFVGKLSASTKLGLPQLGLSYGLTFQKNLHRYKVKSTGASNKSFSFSPNANLNLNLFKVINMGVSLAYLESWSYKYNRFRPKTSSSQYISWDMTKNFNLSLVRSYGGNSFKDTGTSVNYKLLEDTGTYYSLALAAKF